MLATVASLFAPFTDLRKMGSMAGGAKTRGAANERHVPRGENGEKRCSLCGKFRAITSFIVDRSRCDGRGYVCRPCREARRVKPGPNISTRREHRENGLLWCGGCEQWLPVASIHAGKCQPCANADARLRYASDQNFRLRRKHRAQLRKRGVPPVPESAATALLEEFDGQCAYCDARATTWDHVVPVRLGGLTEPANIVPSCTTCNSSKRDRNVWKWLEETGRIPHDRFFERISLSHCATHSGPDPFE